MAHLGLCVLRANVFYEFIIVVIPIVYEDESA